MGIKPLRQKKWKWSLVCERDHQSANQRPESVGFYKQCVDFTTGDFKSAGDDHDNQGTTRPVAQTHKEGKDAVSVGVKQ